ncbi:MAG: AMP-binding protein, partial [Actinomycetota bacterium]
MAEPPTESPASGVGPVAPPREFVARSSYADSRMYDEAEADWLGWWERQAHALAWTRPWDEALAWDPPFAHWFVGGRLNASVSCLDRHVEAGYGEQVAYHWVGEPGDRRDLTYAGLAEEVGRLANTLRGLGVARGDRVAIYLPMLPELVAAMLACARIGAPHSVVYAGFGAQALADRLVDAEAKVLITADGAYRRGEVLPLKRTADVAMGAAESVRSCLVVRRTNSDVRLMPGRDAWYHEVVGQASPVCEPAAMDAEDPLFLLYTSGTTGTPKGIVHRTGGYLTHVTATHRMVFDHDPDRDVLWCAVNLGWITGHSYGVYGPLANRATSVLAEGALDHPSPDRAWRTIAQEGVTALYTTPAVIRAFRAAGEERPAGHDLSSLRLL